MPIDVSNGGRDTSDVPMTRGSVALGLHKKVKKRVRKRSPHADSVSKMLGPRGGNSISIHKEPTNGSTQESQAQKGRRVS